MEPRAPSPTAKHRNTASLIPYLYTVEEVHRLLSVGDACYCPTSPVEPHTMRTLILLLYGAGLRIGEALKLTLGDVNLNDGLLTIRESKFHKSRLVPIGRDLPGTVRTYHERQWGASDPAPDSPFLCTRKHMPVIFFQANHVFAWLRTEAGVMRFDGGRFQPRLHDFRHSFAVRRLIAWYREGKDVQRLLPHLSTYLGHFNLDSTAPYLTMTRGLLPAANRRLQLSPSPL